MTLEEAIKRYTSNAFYEKSDGNLQGYLEFNQLAEWLKDYKRLLEQSTSYEQTINKLTQAISEQAPKTGHWKIIPSNHNGEYRPRKYACSECGWEIDLCRGLQQDTGHRLFCEHCGARMEGET